MLEFFLSVLLVEDEPLTREMILSHIPWEEYGVVNIMQAFNGRDAIKIAEKDKPDLIISDIRMPILDGMSFIKQIRKHDKKCHVIFISAYCDKATLKEAIYLEAIDFVEKPLDFEVLKSAIKRATEKCRQEYSNNELKQQFEAHLSFQKNTDFIKAVIKNPDISQSLINKMNDIPAEIYVCKTLKSFLTVEDAISYHLLITKHLSGVVFFAAILDNSLLFITTKNLKSNIDKLKKWLFDNEEKIFIGTTALVGNPDKIHSEILKAIEASNMDFYFPDKSQFRVYESAAPFLDDRLSSKLCEKIVELDYDACIKIVNEIVGIFKSKSYCKILDVKDIFVFLLQEFYATLKKKNFASLVDDFVLHDISMIKQALTLNQAADIILKRISKIISAISSSGVSKAVLLALEYIYKYYSEASLTIQQIADSIFLSPNHLCTIFKKETGQTIHRYIEQYRVEKVIFLMKKQDNSTLTEIAEKSGFNNANYLAKIFKKHTGLSPSVFRNQIYRSLGNDSNKD